MEFTNIYVKNLHVDVNEQCLQDLFSQFGGRVPQGSWGSLLFYSQLGLGWGCPLGLPEDLGEGRGHLRACPTPL